MSQKKPQKNMIIKRAAGVEVEGNREGGLDKNWKGEKVGKYRGVGGLYKIGRSGTFCQLGQFLEKWCKAEVKAELMFQNLAKSSSD